MKKLIFVLFTICLAQLASAQVRIEAGGALGGFGRSSFGIFYVVKSSSTLSPGLGFDANISFNINLDRKGDGMSIAPGVGYLMNIANVKGESIKMRTQWVQVPLNLVYDVPIGRSTFTTSTGIYYGRAISGQFIRNGISIDNVDFIKDKSQYVLNRNDFGFNVKAGLLMTRNFGFYIGYTGGFLDISDTSGLVARTSLFRFGIMLSL